MSAEFGQDDAVRALANVDMASGVKAMLANSVTRDLLIPTKSQFMHADSLALKAMTDSISSASAVGALVRFKMSLLKLLTGV